jgi:xylan 1,4-beta-xylosidase
MTSTEPRREAAPSSARIAWFAEIGSQAPRDAAAPEVTLPPPSTVTAIGGRAQVTVAWEPVEGAAGYLVHRADSADGPFLPIDNRGGDVLAVPHGPFVDTTLEPGRTAWYAVSSVPTIESPIGEPSAPVQARSTTGGTAAVSVRVDASATGSPLARPWRPLVGSEHLALLLRGEGPGGRHVGEELAESFRIARRELGAEGVRAHAILHDVLGVYREEGGEPTYDFDRVDAVLDRLLETGLRPVVELSFMPRDLASDPDRTVFDYGGIISPPRDLGRWEALIEALVRHLVDRYGRDEVARWPFEVWNEPNLAVFWSGSESDYLALYDATARAVKRVDPSFLVGGPSTAAAGWVDDLLEHARTTDVPVDFLSTHTYGMAPLDLRPVAARYGAGELPLLWTEWGISPLHSAPVNDSVWGAPLVARGMRSAAGRLHSLSYWVISDHFVELGEPPGLFHGGFGLLTVGNLRKPRFWGLALLERLGETELPAELAGDGAGSLVEAWASRADDGRIAVALWNGTLDQTKWDGDAALARDVTLRLDGLPAGAWTVRHHRVDEDHSNVRRAWEAMGGGDWPDDDAWLALHDADRLDGLEPDWSATTGADGRLELTFAMPMPSLSLVELVPAG